MNARFDKEAITVALLRVLAQPALTTLLAAQEAVYPAESAVWSRILIEQGTKRELRLCRARGITQSFAAHITDDQGHLSVRKRERIVKVAAFLGFIQGGFVERGDIQTRALPL